MSTTPNAPPPELEVITVLGPIAPGEMGITQPHEHLLVDAMDHYGGYGYVIYRDFGYLCDRPYS